MSGGTRASGPLERVPVLTVLPADPEKMAIGGIASFVRGFVKFAPDDFDLGFIGVSDTRAAWQWHAVELEGRGVRFLPVTRGGGPRRSRVPIALRFSAALLAKPSRRRRLIPDRTAIAAFHRPGTDLGLGGWHGPRWRVVHLSVHDLATAGSESRWRRLSPLLDVLEGRSFRRMDRVYVVNRAVAEDYRRRHPAVADRISFIPNWADSTVFSPAPSAERAAQRARLASELGVPEEAPIVLFAARLEGQKDPLLLAAAFASLLASVPDAHLLVAGDGALAEPMRQALAGMDGLANARFLGIVRRERLAQLMAAADVLAITSAFETGPTVGLEALACGLPVVTTPVGEVARLVAAGGAGRATAGRSPSEVASALIDILERGSDLRPAAVSAAQPYLAQEVLRPLYEENRRLAERLGRSD